MNFSRSDHEFSAVYIGAQILKENKVSILYLQKPLTDLYLNIKKNSFLNENYKVTLAVMSEGLKIKKETKEEMRPFSSVVLWTSVKVAFRNLANSTEIAFLPLVNSLAAKDKLLLFRQLTREDACIFFELKEKFEEPAILAIVIKIFVRGTNQFECHGFMCESPEDAKKLAETMYRALKNTMELAGRNKATSPSRTFDFIRSERSSEQGERFCKAPTRRLSERTGEKTNRMRTTERDSESENFFRENRGRSLNEVRPHGGRCHGSRKRPVGSPLGFVKSFDEFCVKEELGKVDEILNAIIDAKGMSFNNLRPTYKEYLLKTALLLTKDELYKRSENIMSRQKKIMKNQLFKRTFYSWGLNCCASFRLESISSGGGKTKYSKGSRKNDFFLMLKPNKKVVFSQSYKKINRNSSTNRTKKKLKGNFYLLSKTYENGSIRRKRFSNDHRSMGTASPYYLDFLNSKSTKHSTDPCPPCERKCCLCNFSTEKKELDSSEKSFHSCDYGSESCPYVDKCYCRKKTSRRLWPNKTHQESTDNPLFETPNPVLLNAFFNKRTGAINIGKSQAEYQKTKKVQLQRDNRFFVGDRKKIESSQEVHCACLWPRSNVEILTERMSTPVPIENTKLDICDSNKPKRQSQLKSRFMKCCDGQLSSSCSIFDSPIVHEQIGNSSRYLSEAHTEIHSTNHQPRNKHLRFSQRMDAYDFYESTI